MPYRQPISGKKFTHLLGQIAIEQKIHSIRITRNDDKILGLAITKLIPRSTEFAVIKMRKELLRLLKGQLSPFTENRKLNISISLKQEGLTRNEYYQWKRIIKTIANRVKNGEKINNKEEFLYMTEFLGFPAEEVRRIIFIAGNKDPNRFID